MTSRSGGLASLRSKAQIGVKCGMTTLHLFIFLGSSLDDVAKKKFYYVLLLFKIKKNVEGLDTAIILKKNNQNQLKRNLLNLECPTPFRSPTKSLRSALINEIPQVWKL